MAQEVGFSSSGIETGFTTTSTAPSGPSPNDVGGTGSLDATASSSDTSDAVSFRGRRIGSTVPHCVIEEHGRDDMEITRHPIETGAAITDHAFKLPAEVVIRGGWTDAGRGQGTAQAAYDALRLLQAKRERITVVTGKRTYSSMLIASIAQETTSATENALLATIVCRQVMVVSTQTTTIAARSEQAAPAATASTENGGQRQSNEATPATGSDNSSLGGQVVNTGRNIWNGITTSLGIGGANATSVNTIGGGSGGQG